MILSANSMEAKIITVAISKHENPAQVFENAVEEFLSDLTPSEIIKIYSTMTDSYFYFFCVFEPKIIDRRYGDPD